jgi:hypothetical protein
MGPAREGQNPPRGNVARGRGGLKGVVVAAASSLLGCRIRCDVCTHYRAFEQDRAWGVG